MNSWQIEGTVTHIGQKEIRGTFQKIQVVITWKSGDYEKHTALDVQTDKAIKQVEEKVEIGDTIGFWFRPESRFWEGKWYTNAVATGIYKHQKGGGNTQAQAQQPAQEAPKVKFEPVEKRNFDDEDLPF